MLPIYPVDIETFRFKEITPIQKRFNDLDGFAHVNNAVQQSYFDVGRANYLHHVYGDRFYTGEKVLFIVSVKTDFLSPITFEDDVEVRTSVYEIGSKSLKMLQTIVDTHSQRICSVSQSVMASVSLSNQKSVEIPDEWRKRIATLEERDF